MVVPEAPPAPLAALVSSPATSCILTDFDGTLAPIVGDPNAAKPLTGAVEVLHRLARRYGRVAVVSGRPASFLAENLELEEQETESGLFAVGLYGLETVDGATVTSHPEAEQWRPVVAGVADLAEEQAPPGVFVERKGLSVTLHYRGNPVASSWCSQWATARAEATGLVLHSARMSEELRPDVPVDKGTVVADLASDFDAACFFGDDLGDIPAFVALEQLAARRKEFTPVTVAVRSPEAPPELLDRADVVVDGPAGVLALLSTLL